MSDPAAKVEQRVRFELRQVSQYEGTETVELFAVHPSWTTRLGTLFLHESEAHTLRSRLEGEGGVEVLHTALEWYASHCDAEQWKDDNEGDVARAAINAADSPTPSPSTPVVEARWRMALEFYAEKLNYNDYSVEGDQGETARAALALAAALRSRLEGENEERLRQKFDWAYSEYYLDGKRSGQELVDECVRIALDAADSPTPKGTL